MSEESQMMPQKDWLKKISSELGELKEGEALSMGLSRIAVTRVDGLAAELILWLQNRLEVPEKDLTYDELFGVLSSASWLVQYMWASDDS